MTRGFAISVLLALCWLVAITFSGVTFEQFLAKSMHRSDMGRFWTGISMRFGGLGQSPFVLGAIPLLFVLGWHLISPAEIDQESDISAMNTSSLQTKGKEILRNEGVYQVKEARVRIPVRGGGHISAIVVFPGEQTTFPNAGWTATPPLQNPLAVVCTHPWAVMGGDMRNNVPQALSRWFAALGHVAVRFDFRGRGVSRGTSEAEDTRAAARFLLDGDHVRAISWGDGPRPPQPKAALLIGYSYGSLITGAAAPDIDPLAATVAISPPWLFGWALTLLNHGWARRRAAAVACPKLFILGTSDVFCSCSRFRQTLVRHFYLGRSGEFGSTFAALLAGADHFWFGRELCLLAVIHRFLADVDSVAGTQNHTGAAATVREEIGK